MILIYDTIAIVQALWQKAVSYNDYDYSTLVPYTMLLTAGVDFISISRA
jgi:hypothetical protein